MRLEYACAGALLVSVPIALNGCGGSGPSPAPPSPPSPAINTTIPTTTIPTTTTTTTAMDEHCADNQAQCDHCLRGACLSCNSGYAVDNSTVSGGTCVANCSSQPMPSPPFDIAPDHPEAFSGKAWPDMCLSSKTSAHFFGIGDWGGDGPGHTWQNEIERIRDGGFRHGPDDYGMYYVARQMKAFASQPDVDPDFVLNAGDNFYPGGYPENCGPDEVNNDDPSATFKNTFEAIYGGPGMDGKPWLGVLGNHDYGGRSMSAAWDQQIFHSWHSPTWRTPAPFWSQRVQYQDFAVQLIFLDSNHWDAGVDVNHDICGTTYSEGWCWDVDSPASCITWFSKQWSEGMQMAEDLLKTSTAEWHILVTHYPTCFATPDITSLHDKYGIDVILTGHNHLQDLSQAANGMVTITSGGGGGVTSDSGSITSEDPLTGEDDALGFVDFEISRTELKINMHTWGGCTSCDATEGPAPQVIRKSLTISPHGSGPAPAPGPPAPPPSAGNTCCFGTYAGGCEEYPTGVTGGECSGGDWTTQCVKDGDCNTDVQIV